MKTIQLDMHEATNHDLSWIADFIHEQMVCVMGITPTAFSYSIEVTYSETKIDDHFGSVM